MVSFEQLLKEINDFGIYQKVRYGLICLAALLPPIVTYMQSFIAPKHPYRCKHPYFSNDSYSMVYDFVGTNISSLNKCDIRFSDNTTVKCNQFVFDTTYYKKTLTEQWSAVCDNSGMIGTVQTVYFSGYLVGSFIMGILADHFGRRPIMLSSFIMMILGGIGVAFGPQESIGTLPSYIIYIVSRFIIACGTRGINVTGFVLGMEMMGPSKRTFAGIVIEYSFASGQLILVLFAYLNNMVFENDWRVLAIVLIIPCLPFISYFFILPESPRWLLSKNKPDEAYKILVKVAEANKRTLKIETWNSLVETNSASTGNSSKETIIDIFKSWKLSLLCIILFSNWIINNFIFYGVGLKSSDLGVNPYFSFALSAFVELIAYVLTHFILDVLGRKLPYVTFLFLAGASCFAIAFFENNYVIVTLAMVGKFTASAAYAIIYLYSSELLPTSVRNTGMGICSMMARFGSMLAPKINDLSSISPTLPFMIFGISGLVGTLTAVILPETLGRNLPENIRHANRVNKFTLTCRRPASETDHEEDVSDEDTPMKKLNGGDE